MKSKLLIVGNKGGVLNELSKTSFEFSADYCDSLDGAKTLIESIKPNIIVFVSGDDFLNDVNQIGRLRRTYSSLSVPILVFDESTIAIPENSGFAFRSGANDYVSKDILPAELAARLQNLQALKQQIAQLQNQNSEQQETLELIDKLLLFMNSADNSFVMFTKDGEIEWVNEGFSRMYGYDLKEFKQEFGSNIFEASQNSNIKKKVEQCKKHNKSVNYVAECHTKGGEFKWIQTTLTPVISKSGSISRYIAIESDITKLKEAEEALNQKNEYMLALTNHLKSANLLLEEQQKEINTKNTELQEEQDKSEELLLNILPYEVARQLKSKGVARPRNYKYTTVLFLDFVSFTQIAQELSPKDLVQVLDSYFSAFDEIMEKHYLEKIKTIGDAYLCAGGLPLSNKSNPFNILLAALEIQDFIEKQAENNKTPEGRIWQCRIGVHTGGVIAGVVGKKKYIYDIWGNTVNIAARMQQYGDIGKINISQETYEKVKDYFICDYRGKRPIKHGDDVEMYFVNRIKPEFSDDDLGLVPNEAFHKMLNTL